MKKLLSYLLVAIMMLSLAACGSDSKKTDSKDDSNAADVNAVELLEKAMDNFGSIKAAEAEIDMTIDAEAEGEAMNIDASLDLQGNNFGAEDMTIKMPVKATIPDMGEVEATIYLADGYLYMDLMGQKMKMEMDLSDLTGSVTAEEEAAAEAETTEEEEEQIKEALNPTVKESGDKYVISIDVNWDKFVEIMGEDVPAEELEAVEIKTFKMSMTVSKDSVVEEITIDFDADAEVEGVVVAIGLKGTIKFMTESLNIDLPDFSEYVDASGMLF